MHKKGFIAMALPDILAIIGFALIFFVFFLLFFSPGCSNIYKQTIHGIENKEINANLELMSFLRSLVEIEINDEETTMTMADLIVYSVHNHDYDELEKQTNFLKKKFKGITVYSSNPDIKTREKFYTMEEAGASYTNKVKITIPALGEVEEGYSALVVYYYNIHPQVDDRGVRVF